VTRASRATHNLLKPPWPPDRQKVVVYLRIISDLYGIDATQY